MMSKEPERMQRLADLGFDTSKAYLHGTPKVFEEFDPTRTAFVSPDAKFSEMFSGNTGQTIPVFVKHEKIIDLSDRAALEELVNQLRQYPDKGKAQNAVDYINLLVEKPKNNWMAAKQLHPILKDLGYKGATETEFNSKNLALFNPSEQVKSVWAKGKGPGLIGGTAAAALLGGLDEAEASESGALSKIIESMKETEALKKGYQTGFWHGSPIGEIKEIQSNYSGPFEGIFSSTDKNAAASHGKYLTQFGVKPEKILKNFESISNHENLINLIKNEYPHATPDQIENILYPAIIEEKNVFKMNPLDIKNITGYDDLGEASWQFQNKRGQIGQKLGYDAIPMNDEHGTSYFIPAGADVKKINAFAAPMTALSTAEEINPLNLLGSLVNKYRGAQEKVADVITEQVNPYKKQPADETAKGLGRMMFDPLNLVEGPVGHALMGIELMSNKKEKLP